MFSHKDTVRLSGFRLERPATAVTISDKRKEYQNNIDRIEMKGSFSLSKRNYGMGLIATKLEENHLTSIGIIHICNESL